MKDDEDKILPDPRQVLNDIAKNEAKANISNTPDNNAPDNKDNAALKNEDLIAAGSFLAAIRGQANEDELPNSSELSLAKILGGDILNTTFIKRQIGVILLVFFFIIIYISNRYSCQQDLIKRDQLNKELQDAKYRALSSNSELTEQSRESKVLDKLRSNKDSVLHIPTQPPYIITIPTDN